MMKGEAPAAVLIAGITAGIAAGIAVFAAAATPLEPVAESPAPPWRWVVESRSLGPSGWRSTLAMTSPGSGWLGTVATGGRSRRLLFRLEKSRWIPGPELPFEAERAQVIDTDPEGGLWVVPFNAREEEVYRGLEILRWDGAAWERFTAPGMWPQAIEMVSSREGWVVGNHGRLLHLRDGVWRLVTLPLPDERRRDRNLLALSMTGPGEGWAVGTRGLVARCRGGVWEVTGGLPPALGERILNAVDVSADGAVWVVGENGLIARGNAEDSGGGWTVMDSPGAGELTGIAMVSPSEGWIVGAAGALLHYDGGRWERHPAPLRTHFLDIEMVSPREGRIAGAGVVLRPAPPSAVRLLDRSQDPAYPMAGEPVERAAAADLDGDGDEDLVTAFGGSLGWYENRGGGGFRERREIFPAAPGLAAGQIQGLALGDLDRDGRLDLALLTAPSEKPLRVLLNRGGGHFAEMPVERPPEIRGGFRDQIYLVPFDGDGDVDLYLTLADEPHNLVYLNDGAGRFGQTPPVAAGRSSERLVLFGDLDGDLRPDRVLARAAGRRVVVERGGEAGGEVVLAIPDAGGAVEAGNLLDLDADGDLDLVLLTDRLQAVVNGGPDDRGRIRFERREDLFEPVTHEVATPSTLSNTGDLDHDGRPEILLLTSVEGRKGIRLLTRETAGPYRDMAAGANLAGAGGQGVVLFDMDVDGDLDLFVAGAESEPGSLVFENLHGGGGFLKLRLHGTAGDRHGLGAKVWVWEAGRVGEPGALLGHRQAGLGLNPTGISGLTELHFGLPPGRRCDVRVAFPSGRRVRLDGIAPGRILEVHEHPWGVRHGWWAALAVRRWWLLASPVAEAAKLTAVLASLAAARRLGRRQGRSGSRAAGLALAAAVVGGGFFLTVRLAGEPSPAAHLVPPSAAVLGLAAAVGADRLLGRWRRRHFIGPYRLLGPLGEGGMGRVYRARRRGGEVVALKVLHPAALDDPRARRRFLREAEILARLAHPGIVTVREAGEEEGRAWIAMERLEGSTLGATLRRRGRLDPAAVAEIAEAAAEALTHLHRLGIVHRDVTSRNLFLLESPPGSVSEGAEGWRERVRLTDFGLARPAAADGVSTTGTLAGTVAYMAPEQLRGALPDTRADLYSLGVVLHEALTGRLPAVGGPAVFEPSVPAELAAVVTRLLAPRPEDRPASAEALLAELRCRGESAPPSVEAADDGSSGETWEAELERARRLHREGRTTEAQVAMLTSAARLRETLAHLGEEERRARLRRPEVQGLLDELGR